MAEQKNTVRFVSDKEGQERIRGMQEIISIYASSTGNLALFIHPVFNPIFMTDEQVFRFAKIIHDGLREMIQMKQKNMLIGADGGTKQ